MIFIYFLKYCEGFCVDDDYGKNIYDKYWKSCDWYWGKETSCGLNDDDDFSANTMCCACNQLHQDGK